MKSHRKLTTSQFIALGFALVILIGALLLFLPISSKDRNFTNFVDCIFTSTSSTCVTGLVVYDTYTHWSLFGQIVIIFLIQIGGIGFMTIISVMAIFLKRKINLHERKIIMQASGSLEISGVVNLIKRICRGTFICEGVGAILLSIAFIPKMGFFEGVYAAIFHSISAFCNAGFDIMGRFGEFTSLTTFSSNALVNITIMLLIITGGLGFLVWSDIITNKWHFKKYQLHSKIVVIASLVLIFVPALFFFIFEYNATMNNMNIGERILASLFQSVSCRTAGFNTIELSELSNSGALLSIFLMFIGGSPGSTAGGIKTTTFVVLLFSIAFCTKKTTNVSIGKRQIDNSTMKQVTAIVSLYLISIIISTIIICAIDQQFALREVLFETTSAIGTVGFTMGITSSLSAASHIVLVLLMYVGRVGAISIILLFRYRDNDELLRRPTEKILIG